MSSPADLDPVIHSPKRLAAMAILSSSATTDFSYLKTHLGLSDSDLSKQMTALRDAGYVSIYKSGHGRSGQTRYAITTEGREAYRAYRAHLQALLGE
ncbi:transcriptional regulator [Dermacoccus nishinomiyaensis]|uniref:transcriptional regulator n=1 Tax=Dermacoccus nishinomiyaensis TaxID=1274 RepID=UPI000AB5D83F|nr:transcriptional regulator [Dermacoccus nishinomiyaensis]